MSIQKQFNDEVMQQFSKIQELINNAPSFEANQMRCYLLQAVANSPIPINCLLADQLLSFEEVVIAVFKYKSWIL